jgi:uncharacterized protein (TIGR00251 family)
MQIYVKAKPNAKVSRVTRWIDEKTVEIAIHAPPKEGKANGELIRFLADKLDVPKSSISIVSGTMAKLKRVELPDSAKLDALKEDQPHLL